MGKVRGHRGLEICCIKRARLPGTLSVSMKPVLIDGKNLSPCTSPPSISSPRSKFGLFLASFLHSPVFLPIFPLAPPPISSSVTALLAVLGI